MNAVDREKLWETYRKSPTSKVIVRGLGEVVLILGEK